MAHETTTTLAALYLKDVEREIYKQYFIEDELAKRLRVKGPKQVGRMVSGGVTVEIPAGIRPPTAARGAVEAEKIPTALTAVSDRFAITPKKQIVTGRITYEGMKLTRGKNAIKQGVATMLESLMDNYWHMMGTHLWGGPVNGAVGQIGTGATSATQTMRWHGTSPYATANSGLMGTTWLRIGMPVIIDAVGSIPTAAATQCRTVASITDQDTVVFDSSFTAATDDYVVPGESITDGVLASHQYNVCMTSMYQHLHNQASASYQGLSCVTYPELEANKIHASGVLSVPSANDFLKALNKASLRLDRTKITDIFGHQSAVELYFSIVNADRQFVDNKLDIIPQSLQLQGKKIHEARFCHLGCLYFLDMTTFEFLKWDDFGFADEDGQRLYKIADYDIYGVRYRGLNNLACRKPAANTVYRDLNVDLT